MRFLGVRVDIDAAHKLKVLEELVKLKRNNVYSK